MGFVVIFFLWLVLASLAGVWAGRKGHSAGGFFLLALLLSPLVGLVAAAAVSDRSSGGRHHPMPNTAEDELRACPMCAEKIQRAAVICRFCRSPVEALPPAPARFVDPRTPMIPSQDTSGRDIATIIMLILLVLVAVIAGVSQLGSSANSTFTTISDSM